MTIAVLDRASGIGTHDFTRPMTPGRADPPGAERPLTDARDSLNVSLEFKPGGRLADHGGSSNDVPGGVGIVDVHRPCHRIGVGAEILLANESIVVDNERHDPCRVILSRPGDEREAAG